MNTQTEQATEFEQMITDFEFIFNKHYRASNIVFNGEESNTSVLIYEDESRKLLVNEVEGSELVNIISYHKINNSFEKVYIDSLNNMSKLLS